MIEITPAIHITESELHFDFIRSSGPGGQNVNKVSTAVQLRFDVAASSIPPLIKDRLRLLAGRRMTETGVLIIEAKRFRSREQNRRDAIDRLRDLLVQAAEIPRKRRKTRPTAAARKKRVAAKRQRAETKKMRKSVSRNDY
jgi:ribosome-associated protein